MEGSLEMLVVLVVRVTLVRRESHRIELNGGLQQTNLRTDHPRRETFI